MCCIIVLSKCYGGDKIMSNNKNFKYVESLDYFPKELREKYKIGEFEEVDNTCENKKVTCIKNLVNKELTVSEVYNMFEEMGDIKYNYRDYMITEPIDVDEELKRIETANYNLCAVLLTMLLREDHFSNGSFDERVESGQVRAILERMIKVLSC